MVRIGAKRKVTSAEAVSSPTSRRSKELAVELDTVSGSTNGVNGCRSSKRSRKTAIPYQAPDSIDTVLKAISNTKNYPPPVKPKAKPAPKPKPIVLTKAKPKAKILLKKKPVVKSVRKPALLLSTLTPKTSSPPKKSKIKSKVSTTANSARSTNTKATKNKKSTASEHKRKKPKVTATLAPTATSTLKRKREPQEPPSTTSKKSKKLEGPSIALPPPKKGGPRLVPNNAVERYEKDPTIFSSMEIPHISTFAHSRLIFRAIALNDLKLLRRLVGPDAGLICSLSLPLRPLHDGSNYDPLSFAAKLGNKAILKLLLELDPSLEKRLGPCPDLLMEAESTGYGSKMMFGHGLRSVAVGRGGKEGRAALLKDSKDYSNYSKLPTRGHGFLLKLLEEGMSFELLEMFISHYKEEERSIWNELLNGIDTIMRHGHLDTAGRLVSLAIKKGGYGFNFLHEQSLTHSTQPYTDFKPVSVVKKSTLTSRITPLHCAALNPNPYYLQTLLNSRPEYNILDRSNWQPIHYAAVSGGPEPLKLLLERGVSTSVVEKGGNTPLHLAAGVGRLKNVEIILAHELKNRGSSSSPQENDADDEGGSSSSKKKKSTAAPDVNSSLDKVNKVGLRPLHLAVEKGHLPIVSVLLKAKADVEKFTPAQFEKVTPLMIACREGHLDIVKLLLSHGAKTNRKDKRGRTALHWAVLNGQSHILSYLLRLGLSPNVKDSSGNTLAMYAAAYGWYFNLKLLLQAGADVTTGNDWKLTPLSVAFMKGHIGIVEMLIKEPGVEVNSPVDGESGMTLLLTACSSTSMKSSIVPRLKFLVEELGADCKSTDFKGNNALHLLADHSLSKDSKDFKEMLKNLEEAVVYLIHNGCDVNGVNMKNESPLMISCAAGNYWISEKLIDLGLILSAAGDNEDGENILHKLAAGCNSPDAKLVWQKLAKNTGNLGVLKEMAATANKVGLTPLFKVFTTFSSESDESTISHILRFVEFLVNTLNSDVNVARNEGERFYSLLHNVVRCSYAMKVLPILLSSRLNLDPLDQDSLTPLASLILDKNGSIDVAGALISAGANVNFASIKHDSSPLLLLLAMKQPKFFSLIPEIVMKGGDPRCVDKSGNSVLHFVAQSPKQPFALEAIQSLVKGGANINLQNKDGRTVLHLLANARGNETDVLYDIEDFLLTSGANLRLKDLRSRTPLHYVFVKIGKPFEKTYLDPIELVTMLLTSAASLDPGQFIKMPDVFGATPLHYACMRGATICCSYFTSQIKGTLDLKDMRGNTPFGLAVWCGHEGSSLHFQQQGANFLSLLDTNISIVQKHKGKDEDEDEDSSNSNESGSEDEDEDNEAEEEEDSSISSAPEPSSSWEWGHERSQRMEIEKMKMETMKYPIFQEVVKKEWQGILHLMIAKLQATGSKLAVPVATAIKTQKLRLALKLLHRVKSSTELEQPDETLIHTLARHSKSGDEMGTEVLKLLVEKGVSAKKPDALGSNAIIYAAMNLNIGLVTALQDFGLNPQFCAQLSPDYLGRTAFSALFWKINEFLTIPENCLVWGSSLLKWGTPANMLSQYPFLLSPYPAVRTLVKYHKDHQEFMNSTPLIVGIINQRYDLVSWLLKQKPHISCNFPDDSGRTPLMHACRLNDLKMVKLLFNPTSYKHSLDVDPWTYNYGNWAANKFSDVNVEAQDKNGWTAVDYVVCPAVGDSHMDYSYANVEQILTILYKGGASLKNPSGDGLSPLQRALRLKRAHIVPLMYKLLKIPATQQEKCGVDYGDQAGAPCALQDADSVKYHGDAAAAAESKAKQQEYNYVVQPDPLMKMPADNSEVMIDPVLSIPFDCVLTQVDLSYGMSGLYNFYKMQLVKQPRGKMLILLFTQWGRVGTEGQYQQTPFPTEDEAIKEFKKIFKAKTGNNWDEQNGFQPLPKKYRLVHRDLKSKRPSEISVDFEKLEKGGNENLRENMSDKIYSLVKTLTTVHKHELGSNSGGGGTWNNRRNKQTALNVNNRKLPIVSNEALKKADEILNKIKQVLAQKHQMHYEQYSKDYSEEERLKVFDKLIELSEEYYATIPVYGFSSESLQPIFEFSTLNQRQEEIYSLVHLGYAKELLLAAEYNSVNTNPFEYIYKCLGTRLTMLNMSNPVENFEGNLILQYIHSSSPKTKVQGIYKIQKMSDSGEMKVANRWLLWHGTKPENILSILHSGLQIAPLGVDKMGELFGKGIYFADVFKKSEGYTRHNHESKFIFLCEVALGKIQSVRINSDAVSNHKTGTEKQLPDGFDSSKTEDSQFIPDPANTIYWNGKVIPLGPSVEQVFEENQYSGLSYNEYIVFNPEQVKLRYLIQFI